jgi:hypothetical protein
VKYFNSLDAWRIDKVNASQGSQTSDSTGVNLNTTSPLTPPLTVESSDDDLPF